MSWSDSLERTTPAPPFGQIPHKQGGGLDDSLKAWVDDKERPLGPPPLPLGEAERGELMEELGALQSEEYLLRGDQGPAGSGSSSPQRLLEVISRIAWIQARLR